MERKRKIQRVGAIPFSNFREKNRIVSQLQSLRTKIQGNVRISVENSLNLVYYEYFELQ